MHGPIIQLCSSTGRQACTGARGNAGVHGRVGCRRLMATAWFALSACRRSVGCRADFHGVANRPCWCRVRARVTAGQVAAAGGCTIDKLSRRRRPRVRRLCQPPCRGGVGARSRVHRGSAAPASRPRQSRLLAGAADLRPICPASSLQETLPAISTLWSQGTAAIARALGRPTLHAAGYESRKGFAIGLSSGCLQGPGPTTGMSTAFWWLRAGAAQKTSQIRLAACPIQVLRAPAQPRRSAQQRKLLIDGRSNPVGIPKHQAGAGRTPPAASWRGHIQGCRSWSCGSQGGLRGVTACGMRHSTVGVCGRRRRAQAGGRAGQRQGDP